MSRCGCSMSGVPLMRFSARRNKSDKHLSNSRESIRSPSPLYTHVSSPHFLYCKKMFNATVIPLHPAQLNARYRGI